MQNTIKQYDYVINQCRDLFSKKMKDYGSAWRILRLSSLTDQIFIKAQRIRGLQQNDTRKVDEGQYSEFIGIINYSIMALIQIEKGIVEHPDLNLSIDTFRSTIADECLNAGASIINDITASEYDSNILEIAYKHNAPYVMMHMNGMPNNMMKQNKYKNLLIDILYYFSKKIEAVRTAKVNDIIIDPGFGFSKNIDQNYGLLKNLDLLKSLELPILVGLSRKSMIYKLLKTTPELALNGTTSLNTIALFNGATILRVHDVKEAMECIKITNQFNKQ
jgi:dihydropteroate synthase